MAKVMVRSFSVIEKMERNVEAMQLLKTIAKLVKPIMIKHNW